VHSDADWPFEAILDRVMLFSGIHTDYFMPEPPACPRCKAQVTEKALVKWVYWSGLIAYQPR